MRFAFRDRWLAAAASCACVIATPAIAQEAPAPAETELPSPLPDRTMVLAPDASPPGAETCQIHVWSTGKIKSYVTGFAEAMGGGVLGPALDGNRANPETVEGMLRRTLEGRRQAGLLARLDLATLFAMPGVVIVPNAQPTETSQWKSAKGRMTGATGACYGEIIVRDMYFLKTALFPPTLRVNFTFRDFRGGGAAPILVQGRGGVKLNFYPTVSTTDISVITRGFEDAYVGAFEEFVTEQKTKGLK
jgi:hypothetical protein